LRDRLISEGYQEGSKQEGLDILSPAEVKGGDFNPDGTFSFVIEVITAPAFELPGIKGIPIQVPKVAISDADVDQAIQSLRERFAEYEPIEDRPSEMGDLAVIDYHGLIDGKPIREFAADAQERLEAGHDFRLMMKEPNFLPGFCTALVGLSVGEVRPVLLRLPEDFPVREIAGMEVVFEVTLKALKKQVLPEVTDAFARQTKVADDAVALPGAVRERMVLDLGQRIDALKREQVVAYLNDNAGFDVPQDLIDRATDRRVQELVQANQQRGLTDDEIVEHQEEILAAAGRQARFDVKTSFLLSRIATAENVKATTEELKDELLNYAFHAKSTGKQIKKMMENTAFLDRLREQIVARKTIDLLLANAIITEVETRAPGREFPAPA
jgi:trigger factor